MYPTVAAFVLVAFFSICKGQHVNTCDVFPKDKYIEVGSNIEIWCQTSCVRGKIFWTLNNRRIDKSLSKTINSSHAVLALRNFTHHSATLQCHSADTQQVLGGTIIRTYTKPSKISCIWHYQNQIEGIPQLFTCNWEHQMNSSLKVNYTVLVNSSQVSESEICKSHVTTCTSKDMHISNKIHFNTNISVTVRATTAAWNASSDHYEFEPNTILKMIPPKINVTVLSNQLRVEWKRPFARRTCECQVKFSKADSDGTPEVVSTVLDNTVNGKVIEKMESCTNYRVSARCALDKAPWSDWSQEKTVLTKLNETDVKLHLWRKIKPQKNGVRKVLAMWTEIPSTCQDTYTYTIKQIAYDEHMTGGNYTDTLCNSSTCGVDVNQAAHRINLSVFHNETLLAEDSVYVPAHGENRPQVTEIQTSTTDGVLLISWKPPDQPVRGYMVDWTHNGNQYYWKESKYTNTTLTGLLKKKPYNITVTPLFDDKTGHGTEALQVCSTVGGPGNITKVIVDVKDKSAYVTWNIESQEECSDTVINYTIFYSTREGPMLNVTVDSTKQDIVLKDLNPGSYYSMRIKAIGLTGTTESSEGYFYAKIFDPRLLTALSIGGSILIILVLSLGLCCATQWKKFREKPVPNPGLSSLALWPPSDPQKLNTGVNTFKAFIRSSESLYDQVYTEEPRRTPTPPLATGCIGNPASDQTEEYTDPTIGVAPDVQNEKSAEFVETQHLGSSRESTALLSSENSPFNPYRSQSSVETATQGTNKQCNRLPVKQQEKTAPVTVYVTLNMLEQNQGQ
ncbi:interleukin-31 receptor subunit alpha-like isoform X2 [Trachinotus anak]|uniref:interleukin-31 receptor subunit alpha-like isoform X2 n=1 Tax=Trachinotus anak TaxID=443729 RepID=UPI0039F1CACC